MIKFDFAAGKDKKNLFITGYYGFFAVSILNK